MAVAKGPEAVEDKKRPLALLDINQYAIPFKGKEDRLSYEKDGRKD